MPSIVISMPKKTMERLPSSRFNPGKQSSENRDPRKGLSTKKDTKDLGRQTENPFSTHARTQSPVRMNTLTSSYHFMINPTYLDLERTEYKSSGDGTCRDAAMVTTSGSEVFPVADNLDYHVYLAIRREADPAEKDEWVDNQELELIDKVLGDIYILGPIADQIMYHKYLPSSPVSDTLAGGSIKWTENSLDTAISAIIRQGYQVSPITLNYLKSICKFWKFEDGYAKRGFPPGYFVPHKFDAITFTDWFTCWQYMRAHTPIAKLHAKRIKHPLSALTKVDDLDLWKRIDRDSIDAKILKICTTLGGKDGAGNAIYASLVQDNDGAFAWANVDLWAPVKDEGLVPQKPFVQEMLFSHFLGVNATNNECNPKEYTAPTTNSYFALIKTDQFNTAVPDTEIIGTVITKHADNFIGLKRHMSLSLANGGGAVTDAYEAEEIINHLFEGTVNKIDAPYAEAIWFDLITEFFVMMHKQAI
jgi:hypothetical protein